MPTHNDFELFHELVLTDTALQSELQAIVDLPAFVQAVVRLGREHDFTVGEEAVEEAIRRNRQTWMERWRQR
jgi:hypothetical protein